jgi:hypothetical protein
MKSFESHLSESKGKLTKNGKLNQSKYVSHNFDISDDNNSNYFTDKDL